MAQQNGTVDVQCKNTRCTAQKHCTCIHAFKYNKKKEHKSMIEKKKNPNDKQHFHYKDSSASK